MFVFKAAVVGAGTLGAEIAHVIAAAEVPVVLEDVEPEALEHGLERARSLGQAQVEAGRLRSEELERRLQLITPTTDYRPLGEVDLVIEAVPERLEIKQTVFAELDEVTPAHAILASSTSALSITSLGEATTRPDKVVGLHFFHPASAVRLVEVVEGQDTSAETSQTVFGFAQTIRKLPIRCLEAPGFVVNRILSSAISELWRVQEESGAPVEEVDRIVTEAGAAPMGPFQLADQLGLDTVLHVADYLHQVYGARFYVPPRLRELVVAGDLGVKTGRGFYGHSPDGGERAEGEVDGGDER